MQNFRWFWFVSFLNFFCFLLFSLSLWCGIWCVVVACVIAFCISSLIICIHSLTWLVSKFIYSNCFSSPQLKKNRTEKKGRKRKSKFKWMIYNSRYHPSFSFPTRKKQKQTKNNTKESLSHYNPFCDSYSTSLPSFNTHTHT